MDSTIVFYTNPMSRGRIARWALEEVGCPYEEVVMQFGPSMKSTEYLAINPMGKVPAIVHGRRVVTEAAAICLYLADVFRDAGLFPLDEEKADYYRWTFFAAGPVEHAVTGRALEWSVPPGRAGMVGYGSYDSVVETLEKALAGRDYVCGDRFTAADIYVGSAVAFGLQFGSLPKAEVLERYAARVSARDAYKRASAKDDALIAEQDAGKR